MTPKTVKQVICKVLRVYPCSPQKGTATLRNFYFSVSNNSKKWVTRTVFAWIIKKRYATDIRQEWVLHSRSKARVTDWIVGVRMLKGILIDNPYRSWTRMKWTLREFKNQNLVLLICRARWTNVADVSHQKSEERRWYFGSFFAV